MSKPGDNKNGPKSVAEKAKFVRSHRKQKAPYKIFANFCCCGKNILQTFLLWKNIFVHHFFAHVSNFRFSACSSLRRTGPTRRTGGGTRDNWD